MYISSTEAFETDTDTKTKQETKPKQHKSEELADELKRLQMTEPKHEQNTEQAVTSPRNKNSNARLIGDPGIFTRKHTEFTNWWRIMQLHLKFNKVTNPDDKIMTVTSKMRGGVAGPCPTLAGQNDPDRRHSQLGQVQKRVGNYVLSGRQNGNSKKPN
jgi:hypothetical protein